MSERYSLKPGYAYRFDYEGDWEIVVLPREEEGNTKVHPPMARIDGARCVVFEGRGGALYAQAQVMACDWKEG